MSDNNQEPAQLLKRCDVAPRHTTKPVKNYTMRQDSRSSRIWKRVRDAARGPLCDPEHGQPQAEDGTTTSDAVASIGRVAQTNAPDPQYIPVTTPKRWRRSSSRRLRRPSIARTESSFDGQTINRSTTTRSWTDDATTLAPTTPSTIFPPPVWVLKLPEAVVEAPSLLSLTHDELRSRGVYSPRNTFEGTRACTPILLPLPRHSMCRSDRSMSIRSALSNFAPHPGVRPLMYTGKEKANAEQSPSETRDEYPKSAPLALIVLGICLSVFIISLDRGIITTAIPSIVAEFHSYSDVGWYGSAYLMSASAYQPLYGRVYTSFDIKWTYLVAVGIFEVGSMLCGIAHSSRALILGRAVQGLGSAGILTGSFVVGTHAVQLSKRPLLFAFVGVLYGAGALCGPMLGGIFSQLVSWRWCFYVNLPVGGIAFLTVFLFFKPYSSSHDEVTNRQKPDLSALGSTFCRRVKALDWTGTMLFTTACILLFLALQWSQERSSKWSSARCISTIGLSVAMFIAFAVWSWWKGHEALIPLYILRQRTVAVSCVSAFFIYGALLIHAYYLPIWLQAIKDKSAIDSGIGMVPYMLVNAFFSLAAGIFVSKNGLFAPPAIVGCAIATVGAGMLATLQPDSSTATWIGFQVLVSAGLGMAIQQGFSAVQASLPIDEVPIGTAAVVACQSAGGAIFVSVGNTVLQAYLLDANGDDTIPGVNVRAVLELGATKFRDFVPTDSLPALLNLYNDALQAVFIAAVPLCGLAFICTLFMEWKSVRHEDQQLNLSGDRHRDIEGGSGVGFESPELGSDASTLAHLAPQARARWNQRWKRPHGSQLRTHVSTLSVVPELNISEKELPSIEVRNEGFLAGEMKELDIGNEIGKAVSK